MLYTLIVIIIRIKSKPSIIVLDCRQYEVKLHIYRPFGFSLDLDQREKNYSR